MHSPALELRASVNHEEVGGLSPKPSAKAKIGSRGVKQSVGLHCDAKFGAALAQNFA